MANIIPTDVRDSLQESYGELGILNSMESVLQTSFEERIKQAIIFKKMVGQTKALESIFNPIPIDLVALESPNAIVVYVKEDNSYAIGFDFSLFTVFEFILIAGVHVFFTASKGKDLREKAVRQYLSVIRDVVTMHFGGEYVPHFHEQLLELFRSTKTTQDLHHFCQLARIISMNFVLGHEFGHIALDHFGKSQPIRCSELAIQEPDISTFRHKQEYEADEWGFATLTSLETNALVRSYIAEVPLIYFSIANIVENLCSPRTAVGKHTSATHPPAQKRLGRLRRLCNSLPERHQDTNIAFFRDLTSFNLETAGLLE
jgi:hypothetical protein